MKKLMKIPREWKISRAILPGYDMESTVEKDIALNYLTRFALDKAADKAEVIHDQLKYIRENLKPWQYMRETPEWSFSDSSCGGFVKSNEIGTYLFFLDGVPMYAGEGYPYGRVGDKRKRFIELASGETFKEWNGAKKLFAACPNMKRWTVKTYIVNTGNERVDKILAK